MNVLSLFDGISCGMIALERANIKVDKYCSSEIDKNAIAISEKNYPNIIRLGDITKITKQGIENMDKIDLVLAGSPCQGFSNNGKGLNFEDPRSKLFFNFIDILEWVREVNNPNVKFLLENVHMKKEWVHVIEGYLGVKAIDINSKLVSAQNRPRLYWTNIEGVEIPKDKGIKLLNILDRVNTSEFKAQEGLKICNSISENSMKLVSNADGEIRIKQGTTKGYIVANEGDGINLSFPKSESRRGRVIKEKSSCIDTCCNLCVYYDNAIRRYTINELEKLQTLPVNYTEGPSDGARIKAIGNGWTIDIISHILKYINIEEAIDVDIRKDGNLQLKWVV